MFSLERGNSTIGTSLPRFQRFVFRFEVRGLKETSVRGKLPAPSWSSHHACTCRPMYLSRDDVGNVLRKNVWHSILGLGTGDHHAPSTPSAPHSFHSRHTYLNTMKFFAAAAFLSTVSAFTAMAPRGVSQQVTGVAHFDT